MLNDRIRVRALGFAACMATAAVLGGCASPPPTAERYVAPPVGSSWTHKVSNSGSFGNAQGAEIRTTMRDVVVDGKPWHRFENSGGAVLQDDSAGVFLVLGPGDRPLMRYDPPLSFDFPLEVGKTWTQDLKLTVGNNPPVPMKAQWKVEAYEELSVPAGKFKAWRVVMSDNFGFKQTTWSLADTVGVYAKRINERSATHPQGGAGTQVIELVTLPAMQ